MTPDATTAVLGLLATGATGLAGRAAWGWVSRVTSAIQEVGVLSAQLTRLENKDMETITRRLEKLEGDVGEMKTDVAVTKSQTAETRETVNRIEGMVQDLVLDAKRRP